MYSGCMFTEHCSGSQGCSYPIGRLRSGHDSQFESLKAPQKIAGKPGCVVAMQTVARCRRQIALNDADTFRLMKRFVFLPCSRFRVWNFDSFWRAFSCHLSLSLSLSRPLLREILQPKWAALHGGLQFLSDFIEQTVSTPPYPLFSVLPIQ